MCYRVSNPRYELFCQNRRSPGTTQPVRRLARGRLGFGLAALAPPKDRGLPGARPYVRDLATSRSIRAGAKCPPRRPRGEREGYGGPRDVTSLSLTLRPRFTRGAAYLDAHAPRHVHC